MGKEIWRTTFFFNVTSILECLHVISNSYLYILGLTVTPCHEAGYILRCTAHGDVFMYTLSTHMHKWTLCNIHGAFFTFAHVLCDDINGFFGHHGVELHQLVMSELLHDLSLLQEGLWRHCARLQSLHRHFGGSVPRACKMRDERNGWKLNGKSCKMWVWNLCLHKL